MLSVSSCYDAKKLDKYLWNKDFIPILKSYITDKGLLVSPLNFFGFRFLVRANGSPQFIYFLYTV